MEPHRERDPERRPMSAPRGKIVVVSVARPNFMKIAPLMEVLRGLDDVDSILFHTGQHYYRAMSETFVMPCGPV